MNNYLEPLKVESALRSEKMKLEYRKANKPNDVNILDYTIIEALEKQIPREPIFENNCVGIDGETPTGCPVCPSCNEPTYSLKWCAFCGQRLSYKEAYNNDNR